MIRRDFDLEEMKYFLYLVEQSTDDYLYIFDFTNDRAAYSKSITAVFAFESNEFENATAKLEGIVHPDDIDMLMEDLQDELRRCLSEGFEGFELFFQPIYNPQNDKLSGAEALIRWNSSKYGFMGPDKFIPLLEESALIIPLGRWIIDTAAKACNRWITNIPDFVMHINLSFVQIVKSNIMKDVLEHVGRYSAANNHYVFEITETIEMDQIPAVERVFKEFVKNGFRLAIDDFGTGYSNYGYMRDKTFDIVKVDRSFITDIDKLKNNYLMVSFIIRMAHEMGLHVCIEGVETKEELSCVKELGADYIQGYYYGKPVCMADFEEQHLKKLILG